MTSTLNETIPTFTPTERHVLTELRSRYGETRDLFSEREYARLLFLRWLYRSGHFRPDGRGHSEGGSRMTPSH